MTVAEIVALLGAVTSLVAAMAGLALSIRHEGQISAVKVAVNGISHENADLRGLLGVAEGKLVGQPGVLGAPASIDLPRPPAA